MPTDSDWSDSDDDDTLEARRRAQLKADAANDRVLPAADAAGSPPKLLVPQPPPPAVVGGKNDTVKEAMLRLGIVEADLIPRDAAYFRRKGFEPTDAVRKAALTERSRLLLLDRLQAKVAELDAQDAEHEGRTRGGGGGGTERRRLRQLHYTIEGINKQRMDASRQAMRRTLHKTIQKKVDELEHEKQCANYERKILEETKKQQALALEARRKRDAQILDRLTDEHVKRVEVKKHIEELQKEREEKYNERCKRHDDTVLRRRELLKGRATKTALFLQESQVYNAEQKVRHEEQLDHFVHRVAAHRKNLSHRGDEAKRLRVQRIRQRAREREDARNEALDRARAREHGRREYWMMKLKHHDERLCGARQKNQEVRMNFRVAAALRDDYRRAVKAAHDRAADEFQESCELYNVVNDTFTRINLAHVAALRDERRQTIAHVNEEKRKKAVRARLAQTHREEAMRKKAEDRIEKYEQALAELDRGWRQVSAYGEKARRQARIIREVSSTVGDSRGQIATLRSILNQTMTPQPPDTGMMPLGPPPVLEINGEETLKDELGATLDPNHIYSAVASPELHAESVNGSEPEQASGAASDVLLVDRQSWAGSPSGSSTASLPTQRSHTPKSVPAFHNF